ncbi:MAG: hypothetical protein AAF772_06630 [Acidobacteriota bacterium]
MHASMKPPWRAVAAAALLCLALAPTPSAWGHVKWFTDFDFLTPPMTTREVVTPLYIGLAVLSMLAIAAVVLLDKRLNGLSIYQRISAWLDRHSVHSVSVMRVVMAAVLLIAWSSNAVLSPELRTDLEPLVWLQYVVAALLVFPRTAALGGGGILAIYLGAIAEFGLFHMLDYLHYIGISVFLLVSRSERPHLRSIGLPALYATVGFSLIWLAYEKLYYPSWVLHVLEENPQLALGLPLVFFVQSAAFVEINLGFMLLIGLLGRPLAAGLTFVFFSTTMIFGKVELIGHMPLHATLVVFLLNGAGDFYKPLIAIHDTLARRVAFAVSSFALVAMLFLVVYGWSAHQQYTGAMVRAHSGQGVQMFDLSDAASIPEITAMRVVEEMPGSYDLHVTIDHWRFTPERTGQAPVANEGHGHLFINGAKAGRLYGSWHHLGRLTPGKNTIVVTLNANDHSDFYVDGARIQGKTTIHVPRR